MKRPIRLGALLARIDAYWEPDLEDTAIVLGPYEFLASDRALLLPFDEEIIRLTELETKLLSCLADASGALVGREQLLAEVWGYSGDADTHTVETHIWRLRQKIETDDPATRFLITEPGGYRLLLADRTTDG
jgi:DNA-binding response OmpR family regulator